MDILDGYEYLYHLILMKIVPNNVLVVDHHRIDRYFTKEARFTMRSSMKDGKYVGVVGISCELHKVMWYIVGDDSSFMNLEAFFYKLIVIIHYSRPNKIVQNN